MHGTFRQLLVQSLLTFSIASFKFNYELDNSSPVTALIVNPQYPNQLISGDANNQIKVWNNNYEELTIEGHTDTITDLAITDDGYYLTSTSLDSSIREWDLSNGENMFNVVGHNNKGILSFDRNDQVMVSVGLDEKIRIWNQNGELIKTKGSRVQINDVKFAAAQNYWLTTGKKKSFKLNVWSYENEDLNLQFKIKSNFTEIISIDVSPDGSLVAFSGTGMEVFDLETRENKASLFTGGTVKALAFAPNNSNLIAGAREDGIVLVWNLEGGMEMLGVEHLTGEAEGPLSGCNTVAWSNDGTVLFSGHEDGKIKAWSVVE